MITYGRTVLVSIIGLALVGLCVALDYQRHRIAALTDQLDAAHAERDACAAGRARALADLDAQSAAVEKLQVDAAKRQQAARPHITAATQRAERAESAAEVIARSAPAPPGDCDAASAWVDQQLDTERGPP